jgi:hypothetical protein
MSEHAFRSRRATTTSDSKRAMREQQAQRPQRHCGEVTIGRPNIRAVPAHPFRRDRE